MTAEVQHGFASFQPRARLLKLIGAELISDEVVAVTELVKNAHDADATVVTVRFIGTGEESRIEVIDDGLGMDRETLLRKVHTLDPREKWVIEQRFGLFDGQMHTLKEIAEQLKMSREGVRHVQLRALRKLKDALNDPIAAEAEALVA